MRRLLVVPFALLAACGKNPTGTVKFTNMTVLRPGDPDNRTAIPLCGTCGAKTELTATKCPNKKACGEDLRWADTYPCGFCGATGDCRACFTYGRKDGKCPNCKGTGVFTYEGQTPKCAQCDGGKACPMCKGSGKCDKCGGNKKLTKDQVAEIIKKADDKKPKTEP